jgi:aldose 1-epimerase
MKHTLILLSAAALALSCSSPQQTKLEENQPMMYSKVDPAKFEASLPGGDVMLYVLKNENGMEMSVTNFGARVVELFVSDKSGNFEDVVLGFDNLKDYQDSPGGYFGAPIGRYGNRIANASFTLNGETYQLEANNGPNNLHGWPGGYHNVVWEVLEATGQMLKMKYVSPDREAGFPGTLTVEMTYTLTDDNEFKIDYLAKTDKPTVVNLTHHSFFNLNGQGEGNVHNHQLQLNADHYTPVNEVLIPLWEIAPVEGTPMDFREPHLIGERVDDDFVQLKVGGGYDHNWVINPGNGSDEPTWAATVLVPENGRKMDVYTTQPGVQVYTGNFMNGSSKSKEGKTYGKRSAICLETQHFPDSPNQPNFPSAVLNPGETYEHSCTYAFSVVD